MCQLQNSVLDACVLAGSIRRRMVSVFAHTGLFHPVWSDRILRETRRAIPKTLGHSSLSPAEYAHHADEIVGTLTALFPNACRPFESGLSAVPEMKDPDDRHVVALAIASQSPIIVTENLKDFPARLLSPLGVRAVSTDVFLSELAQSNPVHAGKALRLMQSLIGLPQVTEQAILDRLKQLGLRRTAKALSSKT